MRASAFVCAASGVLAGLFLSSCQEGHPSGAFLGGPPAPPSHGGPDASDTKGLPPIAGGTLLVTKDHALAFASDPDRDRILIVDLVHRELKKEVAVDEGSEPGRAIEDAEERVHVLLRNRTQVLTLDKSGKILDTRAVCAGPRGIAYDPGADQLVIACVSGDLVRLGAAPGAKIAKRTDLGPDLRDVVITPSRTFVSRFRAAEVLLLDGDDHILETVRPPTQDGVMIPNVAWRMTLASNDSVYVSHQVSSSAEIIVGQDAPPNAYGDPNTPSAPSVVESTGTVIDSQGSIVETSSAPGAVLPVDADVSETGAKVVVAASSDQLFGAAAGSTIGTPLLDISGEPIAVRFAGDDIVVQTREPSTLQILASNGDLFAVDLRGDTAYDVGHAAFHRTPDGPTNTLACASCHPEGRDDGRVWNFQPLGPRRTQSLLGGVTATTPFHWDGDLPTFDSLVEEVFVGRMGNRSLDASESKAFATWIGSLDELPAVGVDSTVTGGRAAFEKAGCDTCHDGDRFSNGASSNVGTGAVFQVPSLLGVRYRAPYLHDGCAQTLADRFGPCGGGNQHGSVDKLDDGEKSALIEYLGRL